MPGEATRIPGHLSLAFATFEGERSFLLSSETVLGRPATGLAHPNVATCWGLTDDELGAHFEPLTPGLQAPPKTLHAWIESSGPRADRASWAATVRIARAVAAALAYIHRRGRYHGCLTSGCIFGDSDHNVVKVYGAGCAGAARGHPELPGPMRWAAPELILGDAGPASPIEANQAVDVYALGVVLGELVAGTAPFPDEADDDAVVARVIDGQRFSLTPRKHGDQAPPGSLARDVVQELSRLATQCWAPHVSERPSAVSVRDALVALEMRLPAVAAVAPPQRAPHGYHSVDSDDGDEVPSPPPRQAAAIRPRHPTRAPGLFDSDSEDGRPWEPQQAAPRAAAAAAPGSMLFELPGDTVTTTTTANARQPTQQSPQGATALFAEDSEDDEALPSRRRGRVREAAATEAALGAAPEGSDAFLAFFGSANAAAAVDVAAASHPLAAAGADAPPAAAALAVAPVAEEEVPVMLERQTSSMGYDRACVVCMDSDRTVRFEPCGHHVTCGACAPRLTACPMCRERIARRLPCSADEPSVVRFVPPPHAAGAAAAAATVPGARGSTAHAFVPHPRSSDLCTACATRGGCVVAAAAAGHTSCVQVLVGDGASADTTDLRGRTAVYAAAEDCRDAVLLLLMTNDAFRATVNRACTHGRMTPMHAAAAKNQPSTMRILLDHQAAVDPVDFHAATPLIHAARVDAHDAVDLLVRNGASTSHVDGNGRSAIFNAASHSCRRVFDLLLGLHGAAAPNLDVVDSAGDTLLHAAATSRNQTVGVAMLNALIPRVRSVANRRGYRPLAAAAAEGREWAVAAFLRDGSVAQLRAAVAPTSDGTPLHLAAKGGHTETANILLRALPASARNARGERGRTALHMAATRGHSATVTMLAVHDCQVSVPDDDGNTPLHLACLGFHSSACSHLIASSASLTARNAQELTPLMTCAAEGSTRCAELLIAVMSVEERDLRAPVGSAADIARFHGHLELARNICAGPGLRRQSRPAAAAPAGQPPQQAPAHGASSSATGATETSARRRFRSGSAREDKKCIVA